MNDKKNSESEEKMEAEDSKSLEEEKVVTQESGNAGNTGEMLGATGTATGTPASKILSSKPSLELESQKLKFRVCPFIFTLF